MGSRRTEAESPLVAVAFLCAIGIIAAVIVLLFCLGFFFSFSFSTAEEPCIFEIVEVRHIAEDGHTLNCDSRVTLWYNPHPPPENAVDAAMKMFWKVVGVEVVEPDRTREYVKNDLNATFFKNGRKVRARISTIDAHELISTHHTGVQRMNGTGRVWRPGDSIYIDLKDHTFYPGNVVRIEIRDVRTGVLVSADTYTA
jgi:hypothetical protein